MPSFLRLKGVNDLLKKIKDERLMIKNLKIIRVAFLVQTIGILIILVKDFIDEKAVFGSPLFFVLIVTVLVLNVMSMPISLEYFEPKKKSVLNSYPKILFISALIGVGMTFLYLFLSPDRSVMEAIIAGGILSVCFLFSFSILYFIQKKRKQDLDE